MARKRHTSEQIIGKLRDELLNGEVFYTLKEAQVLIERWRRHYNTARPHSSLGYWPPAPEAIQPVVPTTDRPWLRQTQASELDVLTLIWPLAPQLGAGHRSAWSSRSSATR